MSLEARMERGQSHQIQKGSEGSAQPCQGERRMQKSPVCPLPQPRGKKQAPRTPLLSGAPP